MLQSQTVDDLSASERETLQLKIGGMSCSFCSSAIERALGRQRGVDEVHVSLAHEEALIRYRAGETSETKIKHTLRALGYTIRDPRKVKDFEEQEALARKERWDLASAALFAIILFGAMVGMWLDLWPKQPWFKWTAWGIATYVFFWNGRRIIHKAWGAAWRGITNQHVLLSVGAIGAYAGGVLGTPLPALGWSGLTGFPAVDFFGVVVFLTAYHLLSGFVSLKVRTKASQSVRKLLDMQPPTARVVRNGTEEEIDIEEVVIGDRVRVRPGERVPVDGTVVDGASAVDQSIVTGESIPEDKNVGDEVIGGSINQTGTLLVEVTHVGEESFLSQVARYVEEAKAMKPGIIVLVDRVLQHYVPAVLLISLAALLFWSVAPLAWGGQPLWVTAIYAGVTVLVMGYPCALGMATPLALIRGGGMAAERGILIRSGEAFQILKDITHVVLDKTGTITEGRPRLVAVEAVDGRDRSELLRFAAAAEAPSEHPLARAIVDAADAEGLELPGGRDFQAVAGKGVDAQVDGRRILVGTPRFLASEGVDVSAAKQILADHEAQAHTAVLVAIDGRVAGVLAIADTIKRDARDAIAEMKTHGISPVILTGDNRRTAEAVAEQLGIEEVHAQV
ncbi:MAG: heavy metal translocating P-type ATPase, partial [Alphaproteobacteria bacterium]